MNLADIKKAASRILLILLALTMASASYATTELIAPGTTLVDSGDITAPFSLYIKPASGNNPPPGGVEFWLQKKNSTDAYNTVAVINSSNVWQYNQVEAGGTFRVERQPSPYSAGMDYDIPTGGSTVVSGTVTANAGTNLNTSALQLDTTGATANASLATIATNSGTQATAANQTAVQATAGSTKYGRVILHDLNGLPAGATTYNALVSSFTGSGFASYATPTDLVCINGSASKTVAITAFNMLDQSTAATPRAWYFIKRSTADTGGAPASIPLFPRDSADPAATATISQYTSAPGLGTAVETFGQTWVSSTTIALVTTAPGSAAFSTQFSANPGAAGTIKPIILHGTAEGICSNLNGVALASGESFGVAIEIVEYTAP